MNCYNHQDRPAVGLCKACYKALCAECMEVLPYGVACKGPCVERVRLLDRLLGASEQTMRATRYTLHLGSIISLFLGIGFFICAAWAYFRTADVSTTTFICILGFIFSLNGLIRLSRKGRYPNIDKQSDKIET
jgi:hypothetical protein